MNPPTDPVPTAPDVSTLVEGRIVTMDSERRVIADGAVVVAGDRIRFHERAIGPLAVAPDVAERLYRALILFTRMIRSDAHSERMPGIGPCDCVRSIETSSTASSVD